MEKLSIAIQAGGMSTRMGHDKGLLPFGDGTLVEHILAQVEGMGENNFVVSNSPEDYRFLGLPVYSDIFRDVGALGGIHTILNYLDSDYVLALACDMPFISPGLTHYLIGLCEKKHVDVVIPAIGKKGHLEPFRAIYSKRCLTYVEKAILAGKRRAISFFDDVQVVVVPDDVVHRLDPDGISFININTREDYSEIMERIWNSPLLRG